MEICDYCFEGHIVRDSHTNHSVRVCEAMTGSLMLNITRVGRSMF